MSFSEFKNIADVQGKYSIKYMEERFLHPKEQSPPERLLDDLTFYQENIDIFASEASRSEIIISPLLREIYRKYHEKYAFWIQKSLSCDDVLSGTPDYMISERSELGKTVLGNPILIIVEAKKNDFEQGWAQCLAELVAAQRLNASLRRPVYGIVTDGNLWQFGRLKENAFTKNPENFTIDRLPALYGALDFLIGTCLNE